MPIEDLIKLSPILVNIVVSLVSILATHEISKHTINANRKLNEENSKINAENVGKNRELFNICKTIYGHKDEPALKKKARALIMSTHGVIQTKDLKL